MKFGTAILLVAAAGSVASADRIIASANSLAIPAELAALNSASAERGVSFMDDFEAYTPGALVPQGGWGSSFAGNALAADINPISGNISGRHISDASFVGGFEAFSPVFAGEFGSLTADIIINGGSLYQLSTAGNGAGFLNTRVQFDLSGDITVGQVNAAQTAFEFIDSGANWTPGQLMNIGIGVASDGTLTVSMNGGTIFTGEDTSFNLTGIAGSIDQWLVFAANDGGIGNADGSGDTLTFDNIGIIPAPGAVALAGLGGLAATRRRRA